jgi:hypothetical protein
MYKFHDEIPIRTEFFAAMLVIHLAFAGSMCKIKCAHGNELA